MVKSIENRKNLTAIQKEAERKKIKAVREKWHNKSTVDMTLEERVRRLEIITEGAE